MSKGVVEVCCTMSEGPAFIVCSKVKTNEPRAGKTQSFTAQEELNESATVMIVFWKAAEKKEQELYRP
jgi:hypothetical protein